MNVRSALLMMLLARSGAAPALAGPTPAPPTPPPVYGALGSGPSVDVVRSYVSAIKVRDYAAAYRLLNDGEQRYFRNAENFASIFIADGTTIKSFKMLGARGKDPARLIFVREQVSVNNPSTGKPQEVDLDVAYAAVRQQAGWRIHDPSHPWFAAVSNASVEQNGVRVAVNKIALYERRIELVLTFANLGDAFATFLPYGKSVLHDAAGNVYRPLRTRDWRLTSRALFLGLRLAPNAQLSATMNFESAKRPDQTAVYSLSVGPILREGGEAPFSLELPAIGAPATPKP